MMTTMILRTPPPPPIEPPTAGTLRQAKPTVTEALRFPIYAREAQGAEVGQSCHLAGLRNSAHATMILTSTFLFSSKSTSEMAKARPCLGATTLKDTHTMMHANAATRRENWSIATIAIALGLTQRVKMPLGHRRHQTRAV